MRIKADANLALFTSMLLITLSNSQVLEYLGYSKIIEYLGLFILLYGIFVEKGRYKHKNEVIKLIVVMIFFSIGLLVQGLSIGKKISLILSMFILASMAILPCGYMKKIKAFHGISRGILCGVLLASILSIFAGRSLLTLASEGVLVNFGFNGGMVHKNYLSYALVCVFVSEVVLYELQENSKSKKWIFLSLVLILLTNSRSSYIIVLLFVIILCMKYIHVSKYRRILVWCIIAGGIVIGIPIYQYLKSISETFFFRTNGLTNYINVFRMDTFHLVFGNAEMAFANSGMTYDENIRSTIGWDGSTELVILNILIKNGLLGYIGYFIIFKDYFVKINSMRNKKMRNATLAVLITFLVSAFVEAFLANINFVYTVFCYLFLCNIPLMEMKGDV